MELSFSGHRAVEMRTKSFAEFLKPVVASLLVAVLRDL